MKSRMTHVSAIIQSLHELGTQSCLLVISPETERDFYLQDVIPKSESVQDYLKKMNRKIQVLVVPGQPTIIAPIKLTIL